MGNQCCGEMRNADKQNGTNGAYTTVKPGDMPMDPQHTQGWGEEGQTGVVPQAPGFPGRGPPPPAGRMPMNMMRGGPPPPGPMQPTYDEYGNEIYPPQQNMAPRPSVAPFPGRGAPRPPIQQPPPQQAPPPAEPYWDDQQQQWIYPQPQAQTQTQGYEGQENVDEWGNPVQSTQGHEQQQNTSHDPYAQQNDPSQQHSESTGYDASQNSYSDPSSHSQSLTEPSYGEGQLSISQDSSISSRPPSQSISGRAPSASASGGRPPSGSVARRPPPNPPVLAGQGSAPSDEGSLMGRPPSASMSVRPAPRQGPPAPGPGPGPAPGRAPMGRPSIGRRGPPAPQRGPPIPQQQQQTVDNYGNPIEEQPDGFSAPSPGQQQRPNPIQIPTAPTPTRSGPNNMTPLALNGSSRSGPPTPGRGPTPGRLMTQASSGRIVNLDAPPAPEFNPPPMSHSSSHESSTSSTPGAHGVSADELSHARLQPQGERRRTLSSVGHQPQKSEDLGDFLTQALIEKRNQLTGNYSTLTIPGSGTTTPPSTATGGPKKFKPPASPRLGGRQMGPPSPSPPPQEQENYSYDQNQVDPSQQSWDEQSQQQQYQQSQQQQYDDGSYQQYHNNGQQQYQEWQ